MTSQSFEPEQILNQEVTFIVRDDNDNIEVKTGVVVECYCSDSAGTCVDRVDVSVNGERFTNFKIKMAEPFVTAKEGFAYVYELAE